MRTETEAEMGMDVVSEGLNECVNVEIEVANEVETTIQSENEYAG